MVSTKPKSTCRVNPILSTVVAYSPVLFYGCKITSHDTTEDPPHYIGPTENTLKDYRNTRTSLNTKLKGIVPNFKLHIGQERR